MLSRPAHSPVLCANVPTTSDLCAKRSAGDDSGAQIAGGGKYDAQKWGRGRRATRPFIGLPFIGLPLTGLPFTGLVLALGALLAGSCARTGYSPEADPTFDASWIVESFELDGSEVDLQTDLIIVDIDTTAAQVEVATGCRSLLGSFTFLDDGRAGFTLPGYTKPRCDDDVEPWLDELDASFSTAIGNVVSWSIIEDRLILDGPDSELVLLRAG